MPLLFLLYVTGEGDKCTKPTINIPPACMTTAPGVEFRLRIEAEAGDPSNQYLYFIIYLFLLYMFVWKVLTLKWSRGCPWNPTRVFRLFCYYRLKFIDQSYSLSPPDFFWKTKQTKKKQTNKQKTTNKQTNKQTSGILLDKQKTVRRLLAYKHKLVIWGWVEKCFTPKITLE